MRGNSPGPGKRPHEMIRERSTQHFPKARNVPINNSRRPQNSWSAGYSAQKIISKSVREKIKLFLSY
jgi:hypothetical protein